MGQDTPGDITISTAIRESNYICAFTSRSLKDKSSTSNFANLYTFPHPQKSDILVAATEKKKTSEETDYYLQTDKNHEVSFIEVYIFFLMKRSLPEQIYVVTKVIVVRADPTVQYSATNPAHKH